MGLSCELTLTLQFETRISCQCLPPNFLNLENFIAPDLYASLIHDPIALEFQHRRDKMIREAKRSWVNNYVHLDEILLQNYEQQYQRDLHQFEQNHSNNVHPMNDNGTTTTLFQPFTAYMDHRVRLSEGMWSNGSSRRARRRLNDAI